MDNVDLAHQQPPGVQRHPPGVVFASVPDIGAITQGAPGMLPQAHWGQWWSPSDAPFAESAYVTTPVLFGQEQQLFYNNSTLNDEQVTRWDSPSTSIHSYPLLSPSTEATSFVKSPDKSRRSSSVTQPDQQRRKRSTAAAKHKSEPTTTKSTRRVSTRQTSKAEPDTTASSEKPRRGKGSKATTKPPKLERNEEYNDNEYDAAEVDPGQEYDIHNKKVQERNRIASNKFRVKKRQDAIKLRVDEEDMERANRDLNNCVSDLTMEIYDLKMKLLQHTDCNCALIQDYISTEAKRYIKDLGEGKHPNATPPLPPQPPFQYMYHQHHVQ